MISSLKIFLFIALMLWVSLLTIFAGKIEIP